MSGKYLGRDSAPFGEKVWELIDEAIVGAAKSQLTVRRFLEVEGPYGLGTKTVPTADLPTKLKVTAGGATASADAPGHLPLASVRSTFTVPQRDIAAFEETGVPFDTSPAALSAMACAALEDQLLLSGSTEMDTQGLLNVKGALSQSLKSWKEVGRASGDLIAAVTRLDAAGIHGPYALALAPSLYNLLLRRHEQGDMVEIAHIREIVTRGVVKAPALKSGGVLVAAGDIFATIVIGQDLMAGFLAPGDGAFQFSLSETVALRVKVPSAICVLKAAT